jgi:hypothetical protein
MSILINGMEMPVLELEWTIRRGADGKWYAIDTNAETSDGEWHEIVPVPPHGRLIDADALDAYLKSSAIMAYGEAKEAYIDARAEAKTMPTIIPAEEG